jgi:hypothetical protein
MGPPLILDADGLDALSQRHPPERPTALIGEAWARGSDVLVPALVAAECCRDGQRTRAVEASLSRHRESRDRRPAVREGDDADAGEGKASRVAGQTAGGACRSNRPRPRSAGRLRTSCRWRGHRDIVDAHAVALAAVNGGASSQRPIQTTSDVSPHRCQQFVSSCDPRAETATRASRPIDDVESAGLTIEANRTETVSGMGGWAQTAPLAASRSG